MKKFADSARDFIHEWSLNILILLFGTTTLVQAFVIPTGSMEDTLLIGDHLLVDKLAFAPAGAVTKYVLPYSEPHRGDIIVFRYPVDIKQTFVKRVMGVPGDFENPKCLDTIERIAKLDLDARWRRGPARQSRASGESDRVGDLRRRRSGSFRTRACAAMPSRT